MEIDDIKTELDALDNEALEELASYIDSLILAREADKE